MTTADLEITRLRAEVDRLAAEKDACDEERRQLDKQLRYQARTIRQLERTAHKRSEISERNRAMMVSANEGLAAEIERRRATEDKLRVAMAEAKEAALAKGEFLAHMSHELRTPMNGVLGMLQLAMRADLSSEVQDLLHTADHSARNLLGLLNDILDFSKIEARALTLEAVPFSPWEAVDDALAPLAPAAAAKGLDLRVRGADELPASLIGDPHRYRQILTNLVGNAIKFTAVGHVRVGLRYEDGHLWTTVEDTGEGISAERQEAIFLPFTQADASTTRRFGGTGLGLTITHNLVQLMGGTLTLQSKLHEGSSFSFSARLPVHELEWPKVPSLAGRCIGVGADLMQEEGLCSALVSLGCRIVPVDAPGSAIELLIRSDDGSPGQDTLEVRVVDSTEHIRNDEGPRLRRPVRRRQVRGVLERAFGVAPEPCLDAPTPSDARVLVVEDNRVNQLLARKMLEQLGYAPDVVDDGQCAIDALESRPYDVVLMDCQMPVLDGYAATARIRADLDPSRQPVIIALTANAIEGERQRCLQSGMDDYLTKPLELSRLDACLDKWLRTATADLGADHASAMTVEPR